MLKITEESIKKHLIPKGWKKNDFYENDVYESPDGRYELDYCEDSNLYVENGYGWMIFIRNSRYKTFAICDVEYIEQIEALIEIYKDY